MRSTSAQRPRWTPAAPMVAERSTSAGPTRAREIPIDRRKRRSTQARRSRRTPTSAATAAKSSSGPPDTRTLPARSKPRGARTAATAAARQAGSLLLDPAYLTIGPTEAAEITRVLRTGTSTTLAADVDINVNSAITGGDRAAGGGLTMTAQNNINVNDFIETNNGAINLFAAQGTVNIAPGKAIFGGTAP